MNQSLDSLLVALAAVLVISRGLLDAGVIDSLSRHLKRVGIVVFTKP